MSFARYQLKEIPDNFYALLVKSDGEWKFYKTFHRLSSAKGAIGHHKSYLKYGTRHDQEVRVWNIGQSSIVWEGKVSEYSKDKF
jgi:hypothetical protein